jgi:hypothetical protein
VESRARMRCPVCVLVVTAQESVARWAATPIELGGGNRFTPLVIAPSGVPTVTDLARTTAEPELAVLAAMAYGQDADSGKALQIAIAAMTASLGLDPDRSVLYFDLVYASLSEAARKSLQAMDPAKYEFQSEFARRYLSQGEAKGRAEGEAKGRAEGEAKGRVEGEARVLIKLLTLKFGALSDAVRDRVQTARVEELELWTERVLSASTLDDVLR